jgi:hypothetical protein
VWLEPELELEPVPLLMEVKSNKNFFFLIKECLSSNWNLNTLFIFKLAQISQKKENEIQFGQIYSKLFIFVSHKWSK